MATAMDPLPGTSDLWYPELGHWVELEDAARDVFSRYGYSELRTPIFERTDVFTRSIGNETEVVQKEMYTFEDRGGRSLTLRPEGTAGVMRAIAGKGLSEGEERRVFYIGPMFRGERPAAGRRRQFHQIGVENVGRCSAAADVESIAMQMHFLEAAGVQGSRLLLNTRGVSEDRESAAATFESYFSAHIADMCEDCRTRLQRNVWRILDCKDPRCQPIIEKAPGMIDLVSDASRMFFEEVCEGLTRLGIEYEVSPRLVRGLDYYVHTVFEVIHSGLGAQDAVAGGGRYRITLPGTKKAVEGVGFADGIERLVLARHASEHSNTTHRDADVYVATVGGAGIIDGLSVAQRLRRANIRTVAELLGRSMKAQMRTANKLDVRFVLIAGESELAKGVIQCKDMETSEQWEVSLDEVAADVRSRLIRKETSL